MARSIARLDGLDSADFRDLLELDETRDIDDDDATDECGDADATVPGASKSRDGARRTDRDDRP
jgi:hypothetical protein